MDLRVHLAFRCLFNIYNSANKFSWDQDGAEHHSSVWEIWRQDIPTPETPSLTFQDFSSFILNNELRAHFKKTKNCN